MSDLKVDKEMDLKGLPCPMPIVKLGQEISNIEVGQIIKAVATDPGALSDFPAWAESTGNEVLETEEAGDEYIFYVKRLV